MNHPMLPQNSEPPRRAQALDALRGIAILMMVLSGVVPEHFPAWMHHAQVPPPKLEFNPHIAGITWVDLVFPFFLFSMGAAVPLAMGRRMAKGDPWWRTALGVLQRFLLLGLFAVYVDRIRPWSISPKPTTVVWFTAMFALAMMMLILVRMPSVWPAPRVWFLRAVGWAGAGVLMAGLLHPAAGRHEPPSSDIIIMILANVALGVSLVWALTRGNTLMRLGWMAVLMAIRLSDAGTNWVGVAWNWSPEDWLFRHGMYVCHGPFLFHQGFMFLLFVAIPGTIVGDLLAGWLRAPKDTEAAWSSGRWWGIAGLSIALVPVLLWGLFTRHVVETFALAVVLCAAIRYLARGPVSATERLVRDIAAWGAFWLLLGLLFEPYEGGIKKDPATMSYYFVSAGLACFTLIAFTAVMDALKKPRALSLLADNGQNPMLAYVGLSNIVQPILFLTGINPLVNKWATTPGREFIHGAIATLVTALVVSAFTRAKLYLRT